MKNINEHFRPLDENIKFEALSTLREIQSNLVGISFLPVLAIMKPSNPLKKAVLKFQDDLDELAISIQEFISEAKDDLDYTDPDGEEEAPEGGEPEEDEVDPDAEEEEVEPEEDDEKEDKAKEKEAKDKEKEKEKKKKKEPVDSSNPKV